MVKIVKDISEILVRRSERRPRDTGSQTSYVGHVPDSDENYDGDYSEEVTTFASTATSIQVDTSQ